MPDVTLRPLSTDDCTQQYVDWLNDPEVNCWLETRWEGPQTIGSIREFVARHALDDRVHLLAICVDGRHVGNLKIGPVHPIHNHADLSYFIGSPDDWGKGYATKAVALACEYAFKKLNIHRLQAGVYETNRASRRVLVRNGFAQEGNFRRQLKTVNGWCDHIWYGRCADQVSL